ncbi:hypothetical protein MNBD_ALPHA09-1748 [hydrothermal vent metagenome]|uniref:Pterin-binding domain-containing protein n=1 Tax=hydrothermal vent metagenome TaxID=652676 RepID=A0A3B0TBS5_9ZZZZ
MGTVAGDFPTALNIWRSTRGGFILPMMNDPVARLMNLRPQTNTAGDADQSLGDCIVQPVGLVGGAGARAAVEAGVARWLAGGPMAFTAVVIHEGTPGDFESEIRPVRDFTRFRDRIISARLEELSAPRAPAGGLSWGRTRIFGLLDLAAEAVRDTKLAVARGRMMAREGADAVGVAMLAPGRTDGATSMAKDIERQRIVPVIEALTGEGIRTAVFTRHAETMAQAADAGARILADTGGLEDDQMLHVVSGLDQPFIIRPKLEKNVALPAQSAVFAVHQGLEKAIQICRGAGIAASRLVIDPGVGAAGEVNADLALLGGLTTFHGLGCPIAVTADRSGFVGSMAGEPDPQRQGPGEIVVAVQAMTQGAQILLARQVSDAWQTVVVRRAVTTGQLGDCK